MPLTVRFADESVPGTLDITGRLWDFGDGASSTEQHPTHTYSTPGTYSVALLVATRLDSDGVTQPGSVTAKNPASAGTGCAPVTPGRGAGRGDAIIVVCLLAALVLVHGSSARLQSAVPTPPLLWRSLHRSS